MLIVFLSLKSQHKTDLNLIHGFLTLLRHRVTFSDVFVRVVTINSTCQTTDFPYLASNVSYSFELFSEPQYTSFPLQSFLLFQSRNWNI